MLTHTPTLIAASGEALPPLTETEGVPQAWSDNIRQPEVSFGRCALTGQWGKVVMVDLGDMSIEAPDLTSAVMVDGEVRFEKWSPVVYNNQMTVSREGLEGLLAYLDSQDNPIPGITPDLIYAWQVSYKNGDGLRQFQYDGDEEVEINSNQIDKPEVAQLSLVSHFGDAALPVFTFVKSTGLIYRNGALLDLMYDGEYDPEADLIYARKVHHTWGSQMQASSMGRTITNASTSVVQLIGWKQGGFASKGRACIIAVDEQGSWRPWEYNE